MDSVLQNDIGSDVMGNASQQLDNSLYTDHFINGNNDERVLKFFQTVLRLGIDFKLGKCGEHAVLNARPQADLIESILEDIPEMPCDMNNLMTEFKQNILSGSLNFSSPAFFSFPDCGNSVAGIVGDMLSCILNQNLISSYTSPTASFVEIAVINWLRSLAGFMVVNRPASVRDVGGVAVTGGVSANTIGLLLARENRFPGTIESGLCVNPANIRVFLPKGIGHYSIKAALGWLGLGQQCALEVDVTSDFRIDQRDLIEKIKKCQDDGCIPLALIAYAGDSRTMSIDDFESLALIARENGIWFHIDACHGFSLLFSDRMRSMMRGIELADSVTIDPHKVLFVPYSSSYVLVRDPAKFSLVAGVSDLITKEAYSFGQITPFFGSRNFASLKVWFLIKALGRKGIGQLIEQRHERTKYFASLLDGLENIVRLNDVVINSCVFLIAPPDLINRIKVLKDGDAVTQVNALNIAIHQRIVQGGDYHVHSFPLRDAKDIMGAGCETVFMVQRLMLGNPLTTNDILEGFSKYLSRIVDDELAHA